MSDSLDSLTAGNPPSADAGIFGANVLEADAALVLVPVPWDATASYGKGACLAPSGILKASHQLDLEDLAFGKPYLSGILMLPTDPKIEQLNKTTSQLVEKARANVGSGKEEIAQIDRASQQVNDFVFQKSKNHLSQGQLVGVVGGDHSSPFGLVQAIAEYAKEPFGILHVDAHFDFRSSYEGFRWSHASIMQNCLENISEITNIVHLGIRDFCDQEVVYQKANGKAADVYYSRDLFRRRAAGETFQTTVAEIMGRLPEKVYLSIDIDGMDPALCPHTGTPVPGGLAYEELMYILEELVVYGKNIVGFDLCEVSPGSSADDWDLNVGARVLYKLCGAAIRSNDQKGLL